MSTRKPSKKPAVFKTPARIEYMSQKKKFSCSDYREEMRLIGLKKRLNEDDLNPTEKELLKAEIVKLEEALQLN